MPRVSAYNVFFKKAFVANEEGVRPKMGEVASQWKEASEEVRQACQAEADQINESRAQEKSVKVKKEVVKCPVHGRVVRKAKEALPDSPSEDDEEESPPRRHQRNVIRRLPPPDSQSSSASVSDPEVIVKSVKRNIVPRRSKDDSEDEKPSKRPSAHQKAVDKYVPRKRR